MVSQMGSNQIENILLKRGFQVELLREPQLYDEKRTDFLVRYAFRDLVGTRRCIIPAGAKSC